MNKHQLQSVINNLPGMESTRTYSSIKSQPINHKECLDDVLQFYSKKYTTNKVKQAEKKEPTCDISPVIEPDDLFQLPQVILERPQKQKSSNTQSERRSSFNLQRKKTTPSKKNKQKSTKCEYYDNV